MTADIRRHLSARIDWKDALALSLEDPGFNFSVLSEFRGRPLADGAEQRLLEVMLTRFQERHQRDSRPAGCAGRRPLP